ncbi:MAG: GDSL-type esterase/lipase family protein [Siphonobacter sp.]
MIRNLLLLLLNVWLFSPVKAQTVGFNLPVRYGFEQEDRNEISNAEKLLPFFDSLYQLKTFNKGTVSILHIGDSHLQADFLTHTVRKNFQYRFGNAGRGLVIPFRVAHTNEPHTFQTSAEGNWESKRCIFPDQPLSIGIGGLTVRCVHPGQKITVQVRSDSSLGYEFDRLKFFCLSNEQSFAYRFLDEEGIVLAEDTLNTNVVPIHLPELQDRFILEPYRRNDQQNHATLFGFSLENGQPGVLYHTVGINGAQYSHYNRADYFAEQTAGLTPQLIIISLGTNEAHNSRLTMTEFYEHIGNLVQSLQQNNPQAVLLLTTPADSYKGRVPNTKLADIRQTILNYADDHHLPCWDLYGITGSAVNWRKKGLLLSDGVHYSRQGYELQGNLLYQALIRTYNHYVSARL